MTIDVTAVDVSHLDPDAADALSLSEDERVDWMKRPQWIAYPAAVGALDRLEALMRHPLKPRMPGMLLVGHTNNGKTDILERFCARYPARDNPEGDGVDVPVILVRAPDEPNQDRLLSSILQKLWAPYKSRDKLDDKFWQVIHTVRQVHTRMLVIDEIHDILGGSRTRHRQFLKVLKRLCNELRIPLVCAGTEEAHNAVKAEPQLLSRLRPYTLPKWKAGTEYLRLLAAMERALPLRNPSRLTRPVLADKILALSEGYIGDIVTLLVEAGTVAIRSGRERIDEKSLAEADYVPPSMRQRG